MCIKNNIHTGEFLCSHFNIEVEENKEHFPHIMLHYFKKLNTQLKHTKKICATCGKGAGTDHTCRTWFVEFHAGDVSEVGETS